MKKAAYLIPLAILIWVLYLNYLPFGYDETFVITAGVAGDRDGQFALNASQGLSERKSAADGSSYRELTGFVYAFFKPKAILRNATATVSVKDEGVFIISPFFDTNLDEIAWKFKQDSCHYFNGTTTAETISTLPLSLNEGAFTAHVKWTPEQSDYDSQLIVGHHYWEIVQNRNDIKFYIMTGDNEEGMRSITFPIDKSTFFNVEHTAVAIYSPATLDQPSGYIDLYVDKEFAGRTYFLKETLLTEKASEYNLRFGKSAHTGTGFFKGSVCDVRIMPAAINTTKKEVVFRVARPDKKFAIPLVNGSDGASLAILKNVTLHVVQK